MHEHATPLVRVLNNLHLTSTSILRTADSRRELTVLTLVLTDLLHRTKGCGTDCMHVVQNDMDSMLVAMIYMTSY